MFYVHYLPVNIGLRDKSCTQCAVIVSGSNLLAEEWREDNVRLPTTRPATVRRKRGLLCAPKGYCVWPDVLTHVSMYHMWCDKTKINWRQQI